MVFSGQFHLYHPDRQRETSISCISSYPHENTRKVLPQCESWSSFTGIFSYILKPHLATIEVRESLVIKNMLAVIPSLQSLNNQFKQLIAQKEPSYVYLASSVEHFAQIKEVLASYLS